MSQKNIIQKSLALFGAITLVFGNCSLCGIGLSKVIAENLAAPEIIAEIKNEKYVQYREDSETATKETEENDETKVEVAGIAVQSKLSIYANQSQEAFLPTEKVKIGLNLPSINGCLPQKVTVAEAITKATTGEDVNKNINQNYDSDSGLLTIVYENIPNQEGNIYSEYIENSKDEFEIIYTYPANAYTGNEEEIKLEYDVNVEMTFRKENGNITSQAAQKIELIEKENKEALTTLILTDLKENVYKGFLYSNVQNKTKYDTEYETVSTFTVLNSSITDELEMELAESKFVLNDEEETEESSNGNIIYKATEISRYEFDRMIGQDGFIGIYNNDTLISTVKYFEIDGEKKLSIIDSVGKVSPLEDSAETITITYSKNIDNLKIKTSKPITEGFIHFENKNIIKASEDYGCKVEEIKYISTEGIVNEISNKTKIGLLEPETKISVNSSNVNFSTLQINKTTLTIKLDDTNSSAKLFNNPVIKVKLPEGLTGGNLSSPEILNGNGLKIKNASAENNIITIELEGKQTSYDTTNVSGGVSIVMDIENLDFDNTLPTHEAKIEVTCTQNKETKNKTKAANEQEKETITTNCDIKIVSKEGLLMLSELSNYDTKGSVTTTIDSQIQTIEVENKNEEVEAIKTVNLVNNYDENLTDVKIIGVIGYSDENVESTFDTDLVKPLEVSDANAKVYYSNNKQAAYDDDSWKEEFTTQAKAYKVVLENNELAKMESIEIKEFIKIPSNIGLDEKTYIKTNVDCMYKDINVNSNSMFNIVTPAELEESEPAIEKVSVELTRGDVNSGYDTYDAGDIVKYVTIVKNITGEKIENINVQQETPENLAYEQGGLGSYSQFFGYNIIEEGIFDNNTFTYNITELQPGEEAYVVVKYKVQRLEEGFEKDIDSISSAVIGDEIYKSNTEKINTSQAAYEISLTSNVEEDKILKPEDNIEYTINVKSIGKRGSSLVIKDTIPNEIQLDKVEYWTSEDKDVTNLSTLLQNIELSETLKAGEELTIRITGKIIDAEKEKSEIVEIVNKASLMLGEYELTSNEIKTKIEYKVEEPENPAQPEQPTEPENPAQPEQPTEPENPTQPEQPTEPENPTQPENPGDEGQDNENNNDGENENDQNKEEETLYTISGIAWLDENKDGKRDETEKLQNAVKVSLVNKDIGNFALDANGNRIITTTNEYGVYTFSNIPKGNYIILFEFDSNMYAVTTYKKEGIDNNLNSDAISSTVTIDGEMKLAAITDSILLDTDKANIDIGLMENVEFDLSLDKQITKITVINSKGTETYEYEEGDTAKVDLVAKYINGAEVIVNYKFTVTNEGDVTGYVNSLVDNLPEGLEFSSDLNKDWQKTSEGKLYTTALSETPIKAGESKEIELVLTKNMTEENVGIFTNSAELEKISNLENIAEKEEAKENNQSSAMLIISIKTGSIILYTGITLLCISIIGMGAYLIKKKILDRGI